MNTDSLSSLAERAGPLARGTRWYFFGSAAEKTPGAQDVDLLIVYEHGDVDRARQLLAWIEVNGPVPPLDLTLLSAREERQVGFVEAEKATLIWPSA